MDTKADALIVAAGKGERSGLNIPKQFYEIKGKPVLFYTIEAFCRCSTIDNIVIVLPAEGFEHYSEYMQNVISEQLNVSEKQIVYVAGGSTRMQSVYNGIVKLSQFSKNSVVCIHDGVRPFVAQEIITASAECATKYGAALTAVQMTDTVKSVENGIVTATLDRNSIYAAQTPQAFNVALIKSAYEKAFRSGMQFTDDCSVAEYSGIAVHIVKGSVKNKKLTLHEDFEELL